MSDENGENVEFHAVGKDITEQKLMEEELKLVSERFDQFAYSVSHDLMSPAVGIYGLTKLFFKQYADVLDTEGQGYCEQIFKAAEQIAKLVEQINLYMTSKEAPLHIERVKLKEIIEIISEEFTPQMAIRQIHMTTPDIMPEINADRMAMVRILRNLVDNSLKYGGMDLSEIKIGYKDNDHFHIISVSDDGVGIDEEESEAIYEIFHGRDAFDSLKGVGLGLAIAKELSEQHGGEVWLDTGPDQWKTYHLSIAKLSVDDPREDQTEDQTPEDE